ncbi:hypothetical protein AAVH_10121 [Aphelenchoides avenae]|nr:hypothetical protein AAVH_10121 [Aphelenchus avenae]
MRYALKLSIKYDDSRWLHPSRGWVVAYHGTTYENAGSIIRDGFHVDKCRRFSYGRGIYCSPDPDTARRYAPLYCENGITRQLIIQVRVHPRAYRVVKPASRRAGEYWLVEDPEDFRPYAICVFDIPVHNV